jgi:hypothetical protein
MKEDVKRFVTDLLTNRTSVNPKTYPLKWLTCAVVTPEDLPWYVPEENAEASGNGYPMQELEPMTPLPHWPASRKRRRQNDEHTNGYANSVVTPAGSSIDARGNRTNDEN